MHGAELAEPFGVRLRALRERAGLTQEDLAGRAGLTPHAISALERGTRTRPYPHTVRSLADALGVSESERAALIASIPRRGSTRETVASHGLAHLAMSPVAEGLVVPPTTLFGREADIEAIVDSVRSGARLVTLTGPGGVGKTRLLAAAAGALAPGFRHGVVQVALAPLLEPEELLPAIARAVGVAGASQAPTPGSVGAVATHLADRDLGLVLDNFEHLMSCAVTIGELVAACPGLTVLVSSRAPLRVRGEYEYPVAPLALPGVGVTSSEALLGSASGALCLDRARAAGRGTPTNPQDVFALAEVCRRLAGIPLAIELACARLRVLTPETLLDRLDDVMTLDGPRDLPARQRTMRATLDWSYGLLAPGEQTVFRGLGTFRGGATLGAVERVVGADTRGGDFAVLGALEALVEHSLVVVREGPDGGHRYEMLEPVAQYAHGLLVGAEAVQVQRSHALYYAALAEQAATGYEGADQVKWLALTEAEEANLGVAIDHALHDGDGETAGRITWALWLFWWMRGQMSTGRRRAEQCLAVALPPALRARVHLTAATMSYAAGDTELAARHWQDALRIGEREQDLEVLCKASPGMGLVALAAGDLAGARRMFEESIPATHEAGASGHWMRSLVDVWLGTVLLLEGDIAASMAQTERGLHLARERGDRLATYVALYNLGQAALAGGDPSRARAHIQEGIALSEQTRDLANLAYFLDALAVVDAGHGDPQRVAVLLGAAQALREGVGSLVYGYYQPDEALVQQAARSTAEALGTDAYDDALDRGRALEPAQIVRFALDPEGGGAAAS